MSVTTRRRHAIAAGLRPWLGEEEIALALATLEDDTAFNLQRFADRIYDRLTPSCARRDFHRSLVQSVFLGGEDEEETQAPVWSETAHGETRVFAALLGGFLRLLATQRGPAEVEVRAYLVEKLERFGLSGAGQSAMAEWLAGHRSEPGAAVGREAMRQMVNLGYVLACEYLGPVAADRLLSAAVKEAERLPEARAYPPRGLL